jgi:hypothetical protein
VTNSPVEYRTGSFDSGAAAIGFWSSTLPVESSTFFFESSSAVTSGFGASIGAFTDESVPAGVDEAEEASAPTLPVSACSSGSGCGVGSPPELLPDELDDEELLVELEDELLLDELEDELDDELLLDELEDELDEELLVELEDELLLDVLELPSLLCTKMSFAK